MQTVINLTPDEIQSNNCRVKWAAGLIAQLPAKHEGRNSWLLNYDGGPTGADIRYKRAKVWNDFYQCAESIVSRMPTPLSVPRPGCYQCGLHPGMLSERSRCAECERERADANAKENDELREEAGRAKDQAEALREALWVANQEIKRLESAPKVMRGELVFKVDSDLTRVYLADVLRRVEQMEAEAAAIVAERDHLCERVKLAEADRDKWADAFRQLGDYFDDIKRVLPGVSNDQKKG